MTILLPTIGMKSTNQSAPALLGVAVGQPMIVNAANTGFWPGSRKVVKPKLRSQNLPLTLSPMPAGLGCFINKITQVPARKVNRIHRGYLKHQDKELISHILAVARKVSTSKAVGCAAIAPGRVVVNAPTAQA